MPLPPWGIMLLIIGFYLALGTFMEGFSMVVTTIPVVFPIVMALGYDPIWFGVIVTMLVEIALISPPDGTVLYVLQGMRKDGGPITDIFSGVMPFMLVYILAILILMLVPRGRAVAAEGGELTRPGSRTLALSTWRDGTAASINTIVVCDPSVPCLQHNAITLFGCIVVGREASAMTRLSLATGGTNGPILFRRNSRPFYAVIIHDKCKTADAETLRAYRVVAQDLLNDPNSGYQDFQDLKDALKVCDQTLSGKK